MIARQSSNRAGFGDGNTALEQLKAGHAGVIKDRNFGVENRLVGFNVVRQDGELRILTVHQVAVAGDHAHFAVLYVAECANAVPFDFVEPVVAGWWVAFSDLREHRHDAGGHRGARGPGNFREAQVGSRTRRVRGWEALRDFLLGAAGGYATRFVFGVPAGFRESVLLLEQEPLVAFAPFCANQREVSAELFAREMKLEVSFRKLFLYRIIA